jgi:hypothetical protein
METFRGQCSVTVTSSYFMRRCLDEPVRESNVESPSRATRKRAARPNARIWAGCAPMMTRVHELTLHQKTRQACLIVAICVADPLPILCAELSKSHASIPVRPRHPYRPHRHGISGPNDGMPSICERRLGRASRITRDLAPAPARSRGNEVLVC